MSRRSVLVVSRALLAALLLVLVAASGATLPTRRRSPTSKPGRPAGLQLLVSVPEGSEVDLDSVSVTVDGDRGAGRPRSRAESDDGGRADRRSSSSTPATPCTASASEAAKAAAPTFLDTVPDDVKVGIVTFASDVDRALEPTTDRDAAREP